jgi:hypothetical protein
MGRQVGAVGDDVMMEVDSCGQQNTSTTTTTPFSSSLNSSSYVHNSSIGSLSNKNDSRFQPHNNRRNQPSHSAPDISRSDFHPSQKFNTKNFLSSTSSFHHSSLPSSSLQNPHFYAERPHQDIPTNNTPLPELISSYLQLFLNLFILVIILAFVIQIGLMIKHDVDIKVESYVMEVMHEIDICARNYQENRCEPESRVPAIEKDCNVWQACMEKNPLLVGRSKLSAQTVAEAINAFIEPISFKTILVIFLFVFCFVLMSNLGFWLTRTSSPITRHPNQVYPPTNYLYHRPHEQEMLRQSF